MEQFKILVTGIQRFSIFNFKRSCLISNREKGVRLLTVPANHQHSSCGGGLRILFFGTDSFALGKLVRIPNNNLELSKTNNLLLIHEFCIIPTLFSSYDSCLKLKNIIESLSIVLHHDEQSTSLNYV